MLHGFLTVAAMKPPAQARLPTNNLKVQRAKQPKLAALEANLVRPSKLETQGHPRPGGGIPAREQSPGQIRQSEPPRRSRPRASQCPACYHHHRPTAARVESRTRTRRSHAVDRGMELELEPARSKFGQPGSSAGPMRKKSTSKPRNVRLRLRPAGRAGSAAGAKAENTHSTRRY